MNNTLKKYHEILDKLRQYHGSIDVEEFIATRVKTKDLYEFIIAVMLSQNTSDKNAIKAYDSLKNLLGEITPENVLKHDIEEIVEAIKPAGMYRQRAIRIIELARLFSNRGYVEELVEGIVKGSVEDARKKLMELPGIGSKTADVVLLMYFGKPSFPVDTHIMRITKRLGVVDRHDYESIRSFWMKVFNPKEYLEAHLLLILHGRRICRAKKPLCSECVIKQYCRSYR